MVGSYGFLQWYGDVFVVPVFDCDADVIVDVSGWKPVVNLALFSVVSEYLKWKTCAAKRPSHLFKLIQTLHILEFKLLN